MPKMLPPCSSEFSLTWQNSNSSSLVYAFCRWHDHCSKDSCLIKQTTLGSAVATEGVGLHTAVPVNVRLLPAPPDTGYVFRRTDLSGFEIPATVESVAHCGYATTLMRTGVMLSTVEHLLSALRGLGVDNVFVERLWRSLKYEEVYLHAYGSIAEANRCIGTYFDFYNRVRPHQGLDRLTPDAAYFGAQMLRAAA